MTTNTDWINCQECREIEGSIVPCDDHRPTDLGDLAEKTAADLDKAITGLNNWIFADPRSGK